MHSLPQPHIESLAKPTQEEAREKIALLCVLRNQGREEANIAERLGFGSPESMYRQLEIWGLSGLAPQKEEQPPPLPKAPMEAPTPADERKARQGGGEAIKLPSAVDAAPLFRVAINNLTSDVDWYLTELEEVYQDGRFYAMGNNTARGASPYPTVPEICLIAAYVINAYFRGGGWRDVERLVEKLHPERGWEPHPCPSG